MSIIEYKGYTGSVELSESDGVLFSKVQGIRSLISYEGATVSELIADFHGAVDEYLAAARKRAFNPKIEMCYGFHSKLIITQKKVF